MADQHTPSELVFQPFSLPPRLGYIQLNQGTLCHLPSLPRLPIVQFWSFTVSTIDLMQLMWIPHVPKHETHSGKKMRLPFWVVKMNAVCKCKYGGAVCELLSYQRKKWFLHLHPECTRSLTLTEANKLTFMCHWCSELAKCFAVLTCTLHRLQSSLPLKMAA